MAAIWKGSISFGLVTIPVELQAAVRSNRPRFRLLHVKDKSPVKYNRVCQREGQSVAWDDLVKGFEYEKGKYVVLTKEDFESAALERSETIEIIDFVDADEIDDRFFETSYYAIPTGKADRGYAVLREAMREKNRVGIGKIVLRQAQHLAALIVVGDALVVTLMRFADELVDESKFNFPSAKAIRSKKELEMAKSLVEGLSDKWNPEQYTDEYRANLMTIIEAKLKGKEAKVEISEETRGAEVIDLMERLKRSLAAKKKSGAKSAAKSKAGKRKSAKRKRAREAA